MKLAAQIFLGFSVVIGISLVDSYVNYTFSKKVNLNTTFLTNSEAIIRNSSRLHRGVIEMQSAFRGYLLTNDSNYLSIYSRVDSELPALFAQQRVLIRNSASQLAKLDTISLLHDQWMEYSNSLIAAKQETLKDPSSNSYKQLYENKLLKQFGTRLNDRITDFFKDFDRAEYRVREMRRVALNESIRNTRIVSVCFVTLTIVIGILSILYIVRLISKRINLMVNLADSISKGEFTTLEDNQSDELTSLSISLNSMSGTLSKNIRELEKRNTELNQFAYVVSHDLKAPMRGIYNVIQWIEEDLGSEVSPQMRKYLDIIPERIERMEGLIDGLLDYARLSRDKPHKELVDLNIVVREITDLIVPKEFDVKIHHLPKFMAEKIRLEQVFGNLISNAVKYSDREKKIVIGFKELKNFYEFSVADRGIGIDPQFNDKIFEIFQTLREKHAKESTGIGLAIVKKIIDDQHCTIKVKSELGQGSTFIFTWPKK